MEKLDVRGLFFLVSLVIKEKINPFQKITTKKVVTK